MANESVPHNGQEQQRSGRDAAAASAAAGAQSPQQAGAQSPQQAGAQSQQQAGAQSPQQAGALSPREQLMSRESERPGLALFAQHPFASLWQISREMDRLMDAFFGGGLTRSGTQAPEQSPFRTMWSPQIEVRQKDDTLQIHVDLPGLKQEDVQIEATDEGLAISGQRNEQRTEGDEKAGTRRTERTYGSFYREIPLPEGARIDGAKAKLADGVLEITVPLSPESQRRRRITIEQAPSK